MGVGAGLYMYDVW